MIDQIIPGVSVDYQVLFDIVLGLAGAIGGWVLNTIWSEIKLLQHEDKEIADKVSSIEVLVAGRYVTRDEFQSNMLTVFAKLDKISDQINHKADR